MLWFDSPKCNNIIGINHDSIKIIKFISVIVDVKGRAYISGFNRLIVEPDDPFPEGFTVGDIWN